MSASASASSSSTPPLPEAEGESGRKREREKTFIETLDCFQSPSPQVEETAYSYRRKKTSAQLAQQFASTLRSSFWEHADGCGPLLSRRRVRGTFFLIRHGQSCANEDTVGLMKVQADHYVDLTSEGQQQAIDAGIVLLKELKARWPEGTAKPPVHMWMSPFKRCRATAERVYSVLNNVNEGEFWVDKLYSSTLIVEQNFGLFEGLTREEILADFPKEHQFFTKCISHGGRYYARMPLGESRADVGHRLIQFLKSELNRPVFDDEDEEEALSTTKADDPIFIIVSHGVTLRCLAMQLCGFDPEWCEVEPNPGNASIRKIVDGIDQGYIHDGSETRS